ncbi:ankyrin repeat domain-containing protein [Chryseobacterium gambrini]|uniref:ankyrin repeat domain-containing protein n=1 Tax=Chryseobacterium gambrini TaxID=373672 RepID=UPI0022F3CD3F|nr:ankyrin repeat domain-containing protein [Chryseobacterium gambrini]WBX99481.1 ankyrin repeat domain-containing protein [Chryseobacterium gambrini]
MYYYLFLDTYTSGGESLLHLAVKNSHLYMVELLLNNGADVNIQDESENTALHYAASNGKKDIVALLIKHGANVNLTNVREQKPLDYANQRGFNEITAIILQQNPTNDALPKQNPLANNPVDLTSNKDIKSKLKELKELLEDELISEEEYNQKKAELLKLL